MFLSFDEVSELISDGKLLHISGNCDLLKKLPKGNWIGGSTEFFITESGGVVSNDRLFVNVFPYTDFKFSSYNEESIYNVTVDSYDNGFSVVIIPSDTAVQEVYAEKAISFDGMFIKNIVGWISGTNPNTEDQVAIAVNGSTGEVFCDKAVVLHIGIPGDKTVNIGIINIFSQDEDSPIIEFEEAGFSVSKCLVDGKKVVFSDYIKENNLNIKLPLIANYSGALVNTSLKSIENGIVKTCAPVFPGIEYKLAKPMENYEKEFIYQLSQYKDLNPVFSVNCFLNFLYGELEGKVIDSFLSPVAFGEIAYQLLNQTAIYLTVV